MDTCPSGRRVTSYTRVKTGTSFLLPLAENHRGGAGRPAQMQPSPHVSMSCRWHAACTYSGREPLRDGGGIKGIRGGVMKTKLLAVLLLACASAFAAPRVFVGVGFGGFGYRPAYPAYRAYV